MRIVILLLLFSGSWAITAQKKTLTVNESVLKQRALSPQRTLGFSWVKNASEFTLLSSDYKSILRYSFMDQEERVACTVDEVNKLLPDGAPRCQQRPDGGPAQPS